MEMRGARIVLETLKKNNVDCMFGYPGGAVIPLYDALKSFEGIEHIRTAHEQGAVHGADGYARASGNVGVCIVTSGPGATNTITGIATAYMDSIPLVVICGQVPSGLLGRDSFQEVDITSITMTITKHNFQVKDINNLEQTLDSAFKIAKEGRPGPVVVDIPKDIFMKEVEYSGLSEMVEEKQLKSNYYQIEKIASAINNAKKPIIYAGGGVINSKASRELMELVELNQIPVVNSLMGLGSVPRNSKYSLGICGMHGSRKANMAVTNSDLLIAMGARFSDRVTGKIRDFAPNAEIIHIDIDKTEIDKIKKTDSKLTEDIKLVIQKLLKRIDKKDRSDWHREIDLYETQIDSDAKVRAIFEQLSNLGDSVIATDVGQHQMWTAQYYRFMSPRTFITSGGLGTMGFGLGAAIGAQKASGKNTILVTGDGSFRMNLNEMVTLKDYNIPVLIVLFNNNSLGMVRQWQKMFQDKRYSETHINDMDYVGIARAFGLKAKKITEISELSSALKDGAIFKEPYLIEIKIDMDMNVLPIVPPGSPISELLERA